MESYSLEAILSAVDRNFTSTMKDADNSMVGLNDNTKKTNTSILDIAKGVGVFKLVDSAIGMVKNSTDGAIKRFDTLNQYPVVMRALGYSTDEVDKSMNKLTDGIDGLPTSLDEIVSSTQQLAISTGSLDKGTDTAIALNNAMLASGSSSADAARGIEQYRQMLARGEVDMQSWRSVQDTMPVAMDKVAKSFEDRGVTSVNELYDALKAGEITFDEFNDRLIELNEGVDGFAELAKKNSAGIQTSFDNIKTAVVKGLANVIRAIDDGLQNAGLGSIAENFDKIKDAVNVAFKAITDAIPPTIRFLTDLWTTIEPFLPLIMAIVGYIAIYQGVMGTAKKAVELYNGAQKIMNGLLMLNPIGLVIALIIALVAGFIYLWKTNEEFREFWIGLWESIKEIVHSSVEGIKNIWNGISDWFKQAWNGTTEWFSNLWDGIKDTTDRAWIAIQEAPGKAADWIKEKWNSLTGFFSDLWGKVLDTISKAWDNISNTFMGYVEDIMTPFKPLVEWFSGLWENIKTLAASYWEIIKSVIMGPVLFVIDLITGDFEQLKEDVKMIWTTISTNAMTIFTTIKDIITGLVTAVVETAKNLWKLCADYIVGKWNELNSKAQEIWGALKEWLSQTIDNIVEGAKNSWNNLKQGTIDLFNNTVQGAKDIWSSFKEWISNLVTQTKDGVVQGWENLKQGTINIFNRMVNGAQEIWDRLVNAVNDTVGKVTGLFDTLKEINLWEAGKAIMDSFLEGLQNAWKAVQDFVGGIGDWIRENKGPIQYDRKLLIPAGNAIMEGLNKGLTSGFDEVQSTVESMASIITDTFDNSPEIDLASNLQKANSSISTQVEHNVNMGGSTKPAIFNVNLGKQSFRLLIDDIAQAMGEGAELNLEF